MDRDEILRRYQLATSAEWGFIKDLLLDKIVQLSKGSISPEQLQGMLKLVAVPDEWIERFWAEKKKVDKERND